MDSAVAVGEPHSPVNVSPHAPSIVKLSTGSFDGETGEGVDEVFGFNSSAFLNDSDFLFI